MNVREEIKRRLGKDIIEVEEKGLQVAQPLRVGDSAWYISKEDCLPMGGVIGRISSEARLASVVFRNGSGAFVEIESLHECGD